MLSVIVPTYNEKKNIEELAKRIHNSLKSNDIQYEMIVVDDNSPDGTADFADALSDEYNIKVVRRSQKISLSAAVINGFDVASGDVFCVIDADLSHPPEALSGMYEKIINEGIDIVVGSRLVKGGGAKNWPWYRRVISLTAQSLAKPLTSVKDNTAGYFMLRKEVLNDVELNPIGFKILLEVLAKGSYGAVIEYPIMFADREGGESKLGSKQVFEYLKQLGIIYKGVIAGKIKRRKK